MAPVFGDSLAGPRVEIRIGDVGEIIPTASDADDAILLEVDNGPGRLTRAGNDGLHDERGLRAAHRALASAGVVAVWSAGPDPTFTRRRRACGFDVGAVEVRARPGGGGARHTIWLATRPREVDDRPSAARRSAGAPSGAATVSPVAEERFRHFRIAAFRCEPQACRASSAPPFPAA